MNAIKEKIWRPKKTTKIIWASKNFRRRKSKKNRKKIEKKNSKKFIADILFISKKFSIQSFAVAVAPRTRKKKFFAPYFFVFSSFFFISFLKKRTEATVALLSLNCCFTFFKLLLYFFQCFALLFHSFAFLLMKVLAFNTVFLM